MDNTTPESKFAFVAFVLTILIPCCAGIIGFIVGCIPSLLLWQSLAIMAVSAWIVMEASLYMYRDSMMPKDLLTKVMMFIMCYAPFTLFWWLMGLAFTNFTDTLFLIVWWVVCIIATVISLLGTCVVSFSMAK